MFSKAEWSTPSFRSVGLCQQRTAAQMEVPIRTRLTARPARRLPFSGCFAGLPVIPACFTRMHSYHRRAIHHDSAIGSTHSGRPTLYYPSSLARSSGTLLEVAKPCVHLRRGMGCDSLAACPLSTLVADYAAFHSAALVAAAMKLSECPAPLKQRLENGNVASSASESVVSKTASAPYSPGQPRPVAQGKMP